jgi:hypothetical protein
VLAHWSTIKPVWAVTLEDGTRLLEVKQGPMPADPLADNVAIAANESAPA